ncbi:hypothetical protein GBAR_LOCUS10167, partial [Geodia barretti]
ASEEKYQVNVQVPLSGNDGYHIRVPEGEVLTVCVVRSITTARLMVAVKGETNPAKSSAIGGIDYSPTEISLVFEKSLENQTKCGEFSIIQDGLNEVQETFILSLSQDNGVNYSNNISVDIVACQRGDIILSESTRESFSIVEYCKDFMGWVILCDEGNEWTLEDATVVCRQAGRLGDKVKPHELGNKILNARGTVPQCYGNESHIDDCNNITTTTTECCPVLVDCGPVSGGDDSSGSAGVIAAAVTVPLLVVLAVVCTAAITLFLLWKNGKLRWDLLKLPHRRKNHSGRRPHAMNSQLHSSSNMSHSLSEPEAEYTAPFTGPSFGFPPTPVTPTKQPSSRQQSVVEEPHYEGCDITSQTKKPLAKRPIKNQLNVPQMPLKLEKGQEDYSHLQH